MDPAPDESEPPRPAGPPPPLQYERHLAWPWSIGQTDPARLQRFARRAALVRRVAYLALFGIIALVFGLLILMAKRAGALP